MSVVMRSLILIVAFSFVLDPVGTLSQDSSKTLYRNGYREPCRTSIRLVESPPARFWCRIPNGRAIRIPMEPVNLEVLTKVRVCVLQSLTLRDDDAPCGFPGAVLLWEGKPTGDIEISHAGSSFGSPPSTPDEIFAAVELDWNGIFPDEGNLFSLEYGNESRALRAIKVRLEGDPGAATRTPEDTTIRIGKSGYVKLLSARKSQNASWFPQGEAILSDGRQTYYLKVGVESQVPTGTYEFLTNGYLPDVSDLTTVGFLEVEAEYETGP